MSILWCWWPSHENMRLSHFMRTWPRPAATATVASRLPCAKRSAGCVDKYVDGRGSEARELGLVETLVAFNLTVPGIAIRDSRRRRSEHAIRRHTNKQTDGTERTSSSTARDNQAAIGVRRQSSWMRRTRLPATQRSDWSRAVAKALMSRKRQCCAIIVVCSVVLLLDCSQQWQQRRIDRLKNNSKMRRRQSEVTSVNALSKCSTHESTSFNLD